MARVWISCFLLSLVLGGCKGGGDEERVTSPGGGSAGGGSSGGSGATPVDGDLAALSVVPAETALEAGESLSVDASIRNEGPGPVPSFRTGVYLSLDGAFDTTDVRLATFTSPGLAAGGDFSIFGAVQIPVTTTPGSYRILAVADDEGLLLEPNESNNQIASAASVAVAEPTHPDFDMESVSFGPSLVEAGQPIDVGHTVRNIGLEPSSTFRVGIYLSVDQDISSADLLIGQRSVASLGLGAADHGQGAVTVPQFAPAGTYWVGALADDQHVVVEMDEANNGRASAVTLEVTAPPLPDLAPVSLAPSQTLVDAGQPLVFEESVLNQGASAANLFQVAAYLSSDADIDPAEDILLGTRSIAALAAGATSASGPTSLVVPGPTSGGSYHLGVIVDSGGFVAEVDESNNVLVASSLVTVTVPPLPDLVPISFSFGPSVVAANGMEVLDVSVDVANDGIEASAPVTAMVLLSPDAVVSLSDIALGSVAIPALLPGASAGQTVGIVIPGGINSGSYRVGIWIDDANIQPEIDEGNNLAVAQGLLDVTGGGPAEPNLVPELVDPSVQIAAPGTTFQTVTRVANVGDLSTAAFRVGVYLSTDAEIDPSDVLIGDRFVPFGLGGGFVSVASAPVTVPAGLPDGHYTLGVFCDWQQNVAESDETDNGLAASGTFEVRTPPPPRPNLVADSVTAFVPAGAGPGATVDVTHTVRNVGDVDAGAFRVGVYLSDDQSIDGTDVLIATRVVTGLTATGGASTVTTAAQIPTSTAAGTWYLGVWADDLDAVQESDESDNDDVDTTSFTL